MYSRHFSLPSQLVRQTEYFFQGLSYFASFVSHYLNRGRFFSFRADRPGAGVTGACPVLRQRHQHQKAENAMLTKGIQPFKSGIDLDFRSFCLEMPIGL
jgi:hypothetical protein